MTSLTTQLSSRLLRYFLAGVFAILPLVITVAVVIWVAGFLNGFIGPNTFLGSRLQTLGLRFANNAFVAYTIGWIFVLAVVFLLGVLVEMGARRLLHQLVEVIVKRIPLVRSIYDTSKRVVEMMDRKKGADLQGMRVVFCVFGKEQGLGLLALLVSPQRFTVNGRDYHVIIVPTAPVPVGGGLFFVPVETVMPSDVTVDGLMSIYVSMGVTTGEFLPTSSVI